MNKKLKAIEMDFIKEAQANEWCELAETIIALEFAVRKEKDPKVLKLLNFKLKIFEEEKKNRVFKHFDMDFFLKRDLEYLTQDMYDFEDF